MTFLTAAVIAAAMVALPATPAVAADVSPPVPAVVPLRAGGEVRGRIAYFDANGCQMLLGPSDIARGVPWDAVQPRAVLALNERLLGNGGTARQWLELGRRLHHAPGGGNALSARPFARALKLDPQIKPEIEAAKSTAPAPAQQQREPGASPASPASPDTAEGSDPRSPTSRPEGLRARPATVPAARADWGAQSDEQLARATEEAKRHAAKVHAHTAARLELYETRYFLFYSNLPQSEARKWSEVLDRMYARLAHLFALEPADRNLWHGKALITVFLSRDDFLKFEKAAYKNDRTQNSGFCHGFGSGLVHIVFYRAPSELDFARLLVHESVHGFLHRYRSPVHVPSWLNEGLAEVIAYELVPHDGLKMSGDARAKAELRRADALKDLFSGRSIEGYQYPITRTLSEFMIRQNQQGYVDLINAIKDGQPWEAALAQKYGVPLEQLLRAYGNAMGVPGLQP